MSSNNSVKIIKVKVEECVYDEITKMENLKAGDTLRFVGEYEGKPFAYDYTAGEDGTLEFIRPQGNYDLGSIGLVSGKLKLPKRENGEEDYRLNYLSARDGGENAMLVREYGDASTFVSNKGDVDLIVTVKEGLVTNISIAGENAGSGLLFEMRLPEYDGPRSTARYYLVEKDGTSYIKRAIGYRYRDEHKNRQFCEEEVSYAVWDNTVTDIMNVDYKPVCSARSEYNQPSDSLFIWNQSENDLIFTVENDKLVSISGLKKEGDSFIVKEGDVAIRYTCFGEQGKVFRKEIGIFKADNWKFIPSEDFNNTTYAKLDTAGGDICAGEYKTAHLTELTGLDFSKPGTTTAYYSRLDGYGLAEITETSIGAEAFDKGMRCTTVEKDGVKYFVAVPTEAYLSVTATTDENLVSTITVDILRAGYNGEMQSVPENWVGIVEVDCANAVIKFDKPKNVKWNVHIKHAADGSTFTGMGAGDRVIKYTHNFLAPGEVFTTEVMKPGDVIEFGGDKTYTAAIEGRLTFVGEEYKDGQMYFGGVALVSGTVQVPNWNGSMNGLSNDNYPILECAGQNKNDCSDDVYVMNYTGNPLMVQVDDGKVTSITGFNSYKAFDGSIAQVKIIEENGAKATCYTYKNSNMDVLKKETGTFNTEKGFIPAKGGKAATYTKVSKKGGDILSANSQQKPEENDSLTKECSAHGTYNQPSDSLFIQNYSRNKLRFTVKNDKLVSISGLTQEGESFVVKEGDVATRYTCFGESGNVFKKEIGTFDEYYEFIPSNDVKDTTFTKIAKAGGDVCAGEYKTAHLTELTDLDFSKPGTTTIYYSRMDGNGLARLSEDTLSLGADEKGLQSAVIEKDGTKYFAAVSTEAYLSVTVTTEETDGNLVSTIKVDVLRADYDGTLRHANERWGGTVEIDAAGAVVKFDKPKNVYWNVHIKNASANSIFTGLSQKDPIEYNIPFTKISNQGKTQVFDSDVVLDLHRGTYTMLTKRMEDGNLVEEKRTLNVVGNVTLKISADGRLLSLTGFDKGEKVTLQDDKKTTTYEYFGSGYLKTEVNGGVKKQYKNVTAAAGVDVLALADNSWIDYVVGTKTFDVSKTEGDKVLYFALNDKGATADLKVGKTSMSSAGDKNYVALTIDETGKVSSVKRVAYFGGDTIQETAAKITGTLTMKALGEAMTFNRADASALDDAATVKIAGVAAGSNLTLSADDTITTARFKVNEEVTVNNVVFTAGAAGALNIKAIDEKAALISGTIKLAGDNDKVTVGINVITKSGDTAILVTAAANGTFTIGNLDDGESFQVGGTTYTKAGDKLYTGEGADLRMYNMGKGKAITSAQLNNARQWKEVTEPQNGTDIIKLDLADKAIKANADKPDFNYVLDAYTAKGAKMNTTGVVATKVNETYQRIAGTATADHIYTTKGDAAQSVTLTNGWSVNTGAGNDIITGAAQGNSSINAGAGLNQIKLGRASETITVGAGQDIINGYASGKDKIQIGENAAGKWYSLVKGKDLYITYDDKVTEIGQDTQYAKLVGGANGQAITINNKEYYFGKNINAQKAQSDVSVKAESTGLRFTGSAHNDTVDLTASANAKDYIITGPEQGDDFIQGFGVGDIIQLNGLSSEDKKEISALSPDALKDALAQGLKFHDGGSLKVSVSEGTKVTFNNNKIIAK